MKTSLKSIIGLLVLIVSNVSFASGDIVSSDRYELMRSEFLNVNSNNLSTLNFQGMSSPELNEILSGAGNSLGFSMEEAVADNWYRYGTKRVCKNSLGNDTLCWFSTGGSKGGIQYPETCGQPINGDVLASGSFCTNQVAWSSMDFWFGAYDQSNFLLDLFGEEAETPLNRFCVEMEWPSDRLAFSNTDISANPELGQLVNPNVAHPNLRKIRYQWGTYTSPRNASGATTSNELGGTYQGGGSHFYHKSTVYGRIPNDRLYAVDENTIVACIGDIPSGVRGGMKPSYIANPLLTIAGADSNGITNAASYINHLTRLYIRIDGAEDSLASYPFDVKINKAWVMYEENNIFAASEKGKTLGEAFIKQGETGYYPFTVYNNATELRTYNAYLAYSESQSYIGTRPYMKLYEDSNGNGVIDSGELEIGSQDTITFAPNTDKKFVISLSPDYVNNSTFLRHGRLMAQGTISFLEVGRLRSASYAIRAWQLGDNEVIDESAWFSATRYPSDTNDWFLLREFNNEFNSDSNPYLLRNTLDFINLITLTNPPVFPPSFQGSVKN